MNDQPKTCDDIYLYIGKFAVEFEQICHAMEGGIRLILDLEGLKNERIHEILLSDLTANLLSELFRSLCSEYLKPNPLELKIIKSIFKSFQILVTVRNDLLHGKWAIFLKQVNEEYQSAALGNKLHRNSKGAASKKFDFSVDDFKSHYEQAHQSLSSISKLVHCISGNYLLKNNFQEINKDVYQPINGFCI